MLDNLPRESRTDIVPRQRDLDTPLLRRQLEMQVQKQTLHKRFNPTGGISSWTSYASQLYVRDVAIDLQRGCFWVATWGGVLCWIPSANTCIRHTSEHGLIGNATSHVVVDNNGVVWISGQDSGLCYLSTSGSTIWQSHRDTQSLTVQCIVPRPKSGIYVALRQPNGQYILGEIAHPEHSLHLIAQGGVACREIRALLVDSKGALWTGNAWGLHRYAKNELRESFAPYYEQILVLCLAENRDGGLWLGTNQGIYHCQTDPTTIFKQNTNWPHDEVVDMDLDFETGELWIGTVQEIGYLLNDSWRTIRSIPSTMHQLSTVIRTELDIDEARGSHDMMNQTLVGGPNGLYSVGEGEYKELYTLSTEDNISNAISCLWADDATVWVGGMRGLYYFDGQIWHSYTHDAPNLRDVRAILPEGSVERLWIGRRWSGLDLLENGIQAKDSPLTGPVVSLNAGSGSSLWAATVDTIYFKSSINKTWQPIAHPVREHIGGRAIRNIHTQTTTEPGGSSMETLWVGTSSGLFRYRPDIGLRDNVQGDLELLPIQALALNPVTNCLWIGTSGGLFSEPSWKCHREIDVRALAFSQSTEKMWLGTEKGLEVWPLAVKESMLIGEPEAHFTIRNSGLAADAVTTLAIRTINGNPEVWIGSAMGVSCYRCESGDLLTRRS
jgi:ligand-binding sensor domain-containing protein